MSTQAPALSVAYVVKGFCDSAYYEPALDQKSNRCSEMELFAAIAAAADVIEAVWQERYEGKDTWSLVWEYEVVEPFGDFLARYMDATGDLPSDAEMRKHLNDELDKYDEEETK